MCRYNYGNGKCANIDVDAFFCVGDRECSITDIMKMRNIREVGDNESWHAFHSKIWAFGKEDGSK